jgi:hypothetical protein
VQLPFAGFSPGHNHEERIEEPANRHSARRHHEAGRGREFAGWRPGAALVRQQAAAERSDDQQPAGGHRPAAGADGQRAAPALDAAAPIEAAERVVERGDVDALVVGDRRPRDFGPDAPAPEHAPVAGREAIEEAVGRAREQAIVEGQNLPRRAPQLTLPDREAREQIEGGDAAVFERGIEPIADDARRATHDRAEGSAPDLVAVARPERDDLGGLAAGHEPAPLPQQRGGNRAGVGRLPERRAGRGRDRHQTAELRGDEDAILTGGRPAGGGDLRHPADLAVAVIQRDDSAGAQRHVHLRRVGRRIGRKRSRQWYAPGKLGLQPPRGGRRGSRVRRYGEADRHETSEEQEKGRGGRDATISGGAKGGHTAYNS